MSTTEKIDETAELKRLLDLIAGGFTIPGFKGSHEDCRIAMLQEVMHAAQTYAREALTLLPELARLRAELESEQKAHEQIAAYLLPLVGTGDGTSVDAAKKAAEMLARLRAEPQPKIMSDLDSMATGKCPTCGGGVEASVHEVISLRAERDQAKDEIEVLKGEIKAADDGSGLTNIQEQHDAQLKAERDARVKAEAERGYWQTRAETAELKVLTFHEEIVKLGAERDGLRDALQALVTKLNLALPEIESMCVMEHIHGRPYQGPQFGEELKAAEKLLLSMKEPATEKVPCPTCDGLRYSRLVIESRLNQIIQEAQGGLAALPEKEKP
jgi:cell division septum initiation protein DivIVA